MRRRPSSIRSPYRAPAAERPPAGRPVGPWLPPGSRSGLRHSGEGRRSSGELLTLEAIENVGSEGMIDRQVRIIEVIARIAVHAEPFPGVPHANLSRRQPISTQGVKCASKV